MALRKFVTGTAHGKEFVYEIATYECKGPEYRGNKLAEALTPLPKPTKLDDFLHEIPKFTAAEKRKTPFERRAILNRVLRFFFAINRVLDLAEHIYNLVLRGYAKRAPGTAEAGRIMQAQYMKDIPELDSVRGDVVDWVSVLTGFPGCGKSTALKRIVRELFPPLIYHPELEIWQIPVLLVYLPYNGRNGVSLAIAIIRAIDKIYPVPNYAEVYLSGARLPGEDKLLDDAKHLMGVHRVGLMLVDDAQNTGPHPLENYDGGLLKQMKRPKTPVYWAAGLLLNAARTLKMPMMFSATAELERALGRAMRTLRLNYGHGLPHWDPLDARLRQESDSEFDLLMNELWLVTPLRDHPRYNPDFRNIFHAYTFGIQDFVVKLYYVVLWRTLMLGRETFTVADVHEIAQEYFRPLAKIALRLRQFAKTQSEAARQELAQIIDIAIDLGLSEEAAGAIKAVDQLGAKESRKEAKELPAEYTPRRARTGTKAKAPDVPEPVASDSSAIGREDD